MSDLVADLDKVKKDLRSLLISAPNGLTPELLQKDYLSVIGQPVPFQKFGFSNCTDFFRSLKDILQVTCRRNEVLLFGIADESTKHILKMVQRQKKPKFYSCVSSTTESVSKKKFTNYSQYPSAFTRSCMVKVLNKYSDGFSITKLHEYYNEINGTSLDIKGVQTIPSFILSMPDIALLDYGKKERNGNNLYIFPSKSLTKLNKNNSSSSATVRPPQTNSLLNLPNASNVNNTRSWVSSLPSCSSSSSNSSRTIKKNLTKIKESRTLRETNPGRTVNSISNLPKLQKAISPTPGGFLTTHEKRLSSSSLEASVSSNKNVSNLPKNLNTPNDDILGFDDDTPPACEIIKQEIVALLREHRSEIRSVKLPSLYKQKYGKELNLHNLGYYSIIELVATMTNQISMCRVSRTGDWLLKLRNFLSDRDNDSTKAEHVDKAAQLAVVEEQFKELLNRYKGGIAISSLEDIYEMHFERSLPLKDQSCRSAADLICKIADTLDLSNGHLCIQPSSACDAKQKAEPPIQSAPLDAVGFGVKFNPPFLPTPQWGYFACYVTYVNTPSDFRIQVISDDTTGAFNKLMDDIEKTYTHSTAKAYRIPPHMIVPGQVCVAIYHGDNNYNRAIIEDYPTAGFVKVRYVDYGDIASVSTGAVYFLKQKYQELPILEVHARLANVRPVDFKQWDKSAQKLLVAFSKNRELSAKVIGETDCNGHTVFALELCDVSSYDDIFVSDLLIQKGLAVVQNDDELTPVEIEHLFENQNNKKKSTSPKGLPPPYQETVPPPLIDASTQNISQPTVDPPIPNLPPLSVPQPPPGFGNAAPQQSRTANEISRLLEKLELQKQAMLDIEKIKSVTRESKKVDSSSKKSKQQRRYLKSYSLADTLTIHVVNFKGNPLLLSGEISRIFRPNCDDMLAPLLMMREIHEKFPELVLAHNNENEFLFNEFAQMKVEEAFKNDGQLKSVITLHRLTDVPDMVSELDHPSKDVIIPCLHEIIGLFDPDDAYWYQDTTSCAEDDSMFDKPCSSSSLTNTVNRKMSKITGSGDKKQSPYRSKQELKTKKDTLLQQIAFSSESSMGAFSQLKDVIQDMSELGDGDAGRGTTFLGDIPSEENESCKNVFAEIRRSLEASYKNSKNSAQSSNYT